MAGHFFALVLCALFVADPRSVTDPLAHRSRGGERQAALDSPNAPTREEKQAKPVLHVGFKSHKMQ